MNMWSSFEPSTLITLSILVPLMGAFLVLITGKTPNLREAVTLITSIALFSIVVAITDNTFNGIAMQTVWVEVLPALSIAFHVEPLRVLFAVVASFLWIITSISIQDADIVSPQSLIQFFKMDTPCFEELYQALQTS